ncbi:hypothetical protein [Saccharibacillus sp. JS10]|uniref:hypothetical protein n=1 Tax=Saccharibacillus sp. JS10 TaxID=2950552 RepID=UPI00210D679B|nr:hypothetical protein [Saccharibacillus sp. JS10]MCQ4087593.1 hypothetical protein [Saccharibacillus sp. JS10]
MKILKISLCITGMLSLFGGVASAESVDLSKMNQSESIVNNYELNENDGIIKNEETYNNYLKEHGYPSELISQYELEQKKSLYDNGAYYLSSQKVNDFVGDPKSEGEYSIQALQDTNFVHTVSVSRIRTSQKGIAQFQVNYNWSWKYAPVFTGEDKFGLAWNNDYSVVNNSAKHSYKYFFNDNITGELKTSGGVQASGYADIQPGTGIGWIVNLVSNGRPQEHKGWSTITLQRGHDYSGNKITSSMVANYFHKRLRVNPSGAFSFAKEPSISLSVEYGYEGATPSSDTWSWSQSDYLK